MNEKKEKEIKTEEKTDVAAKDFAEGINEGNNISAEKSPICFMGLGTPLKRQKSLRPVAIPTPQIRQTQNTSLLHTREANLSEKPAILRKILGRFGEFCAT